MVCELIDRQAAQAEERTNKRTETHACDCISREAAIEALRDEFKRTPTNAIRAMDTIKNLPSAQSEPEELDFVQPHKKIDVRLEIGQPDRSLWFRIGEICVDESKGFISAGRAVEKIRELLREAERREE